jgi:hypothetical protein
LSVHENLQRQFTDEKAAAYESSRSAWLSREPMLSYVLRRRLRMGFESLKQLQGAKLDLTTASVLFVCAGAGDVFGHFGCRCTNGNIARPKAERVPGERGAASMP